jgi:imidazolonepropionase
MIRVLTHASQLMTGEGFVSADGRRPTESHLGLIEDGAIVYELRRTHGHVVPGEIKWVGKTSDLPKKYLKAKSKSLKGRKAITAGWVDCHNHLVFGGDRSNEFARRCAGESYEEIAKKGGGIVSTIQPTRDLSEKALYSSAKKRLAEARDYGVRTLEMKSGYGLSVEAELKLLRVANRLKKENPDLNFQITFLGAHAVPPGANLDQYFQEVLDEQLPAVVDSGLADACDIFIDRGYFTREQGQSLLSRAKEMGLKVKVHADELVDTDSARLAVELGALSADHLLQISDRGIDSMAKSDTVAVLLPGTAYYIKADYAPARRLIDSGAAVAISTDFNPGSSTMNSLPFIMNLSALYMGMSRAEILAGVTYSAAKALGMHHEIGALTPGRQAQLTVLPFETFEEAYYRVGWSPSVYKVKAGRF